MDFENFGMPETIGTVLTGFVVVFLALVILVIIFWAFGRIMDNINGVGKKKQESVKPAQPAAPKAAPAPKKVVEVATDGVSDEVIAAITGAISAILAEEGDGKSYVVKSIKRVRKNRHAWGKAGVQENTRPF